MTWAECCRHFGFSLGFSEMGILLCFTRVLVEWVPSAHSPHKLVSQTVQYMLAMCSSFSSHLTVSSLLSLSLITDGSCSTWRRSNSSNNAKFFFKPQTPESPSSVDCLSKGQWSLCPRTGSRVKQSWQTVCPHNNNLGTLSPWRVNTSSQTRHSNTWNW